MRFNKAVLCRRGVLLGGICGAALVGLFAGHAFPVGLKYFSYLLLPGLFYFVRVRSSRWLLIVVVVGFVLGVLRSNMYQQRVAAYYPLYMHTVQFRLRATDDAVYGTNSQLQFLGRQIRGPDGPLVGSVQVSGFGVNGVSAGDEMLVSGKLYPSLGTSQGRLSFAKLSLVAHHPTLGAYVRERFASGMQSALPEPCASFAMGLLVGQRATLPADMKQALLMVGLTHIIAVSGYNLTIMLNASRRVFAKRSKRLSTLLALGLMAGFLLVSGASPSIVRAAIVSMLSIGASYYGRTLNALVLLLIAAAITAYANPLYIWGDPSWYLSFLAFFGVLVVAPAVHDWLPSRFADTVVGGVAVESLAAEAMTMPYVLHTFGQVSLIGLVANVLVTTLVPLAMLLSFMAGLAGMIVWPFAGWFGWPARWLLGYMLSVAVILSKLPHIFLEQIVLSTKATLGLYCAVLAAVSLKHFKLRAKTAIITDRNQLREEPHLHVRT